MGCMSRRESFPDAVRRRAASFDRYSRWTVTHPTLVSPSAAVESVGALLSILPQASRERPIDATGVIRLHAALKLLAR
jgi:hypothetical protein